MIVSSSLASAQTLRDASSTKTCHFCLICNITFLLFIRSLLCIVLVQVQSRLERGGGNSSCSSIFFSYVRARASQHDGLQLVKRVKIENLFFTWLQGLRGCPTRPTCKTRWDPCRYRRHWSLQLRRCASDPPLICLLVFVGGGVPGGRAISRRVQKKKKKKSVSGENKERRRIRRV